MQRARFIFIGILTTFIITTISFSQIKLKIQNVNTNSPGCSNSSYETESDCLTNGICGGGGYGDPSIYNSQGKAVCESNGYCASEPNVVAGTETASTNKTDCLDNNTNGGFGSWFYYSWSNSWHDGTLDIHITNTSSFCTYCTGSLNAIGANEEKICRDLGTILSPSTFHPGDAEIPNAATCSGACTNITGADVSQYENDIPCTVGNNSTTNGICSDLTYTSKNTCIAAEGTWTKNTWTASAIDGQWFNGEIGGYQFRLDGIKLTDASGGISDASFFDSSVSDSVVVAAAYILVNGNKVTIPISEGVLTTIGFTDLDGAGICFGQEYNACSNAYDADLVSDSSIPIALCVSSEWSECWCKDTSNNAPDECGECTGAGKTNSTGFGLCCETVGQPLFTGAADCAGVCGGTSQDTDGDGTCNETDSCPIDPLNDADGDTVCGNIYGIDSCEGFDNLIDADSDGIPDACDVCADSDDTADVDGDDVPDACDNCLTVENGAIDATSTFFDSTYNIVIGFNNKPYEQVDTDGDGVGDACDTCAETVAGATVDTAGCSEEQLSISQIGSYLPEEFAISQNFPNPFNPVTSITFDVAEFDDISLIVYDLIGKEVATLVSGTYTPGSYIVTWNAINNAGDGITSGMYIYRFTSSEKSITRKMLYLK